MMHSTLIGEEASYGGGPRDTGDVFVGREAELTSLRRCIQTAQSGHGGVALVTGDPGIGKTRLAQEAANEAARCGMRVFWGRCWEGDGAPAFWPWEQLVRTYAREVPTDECVAALGSGATDIVRVIPGIRKWLPSLDTPDSRDETPAARFRFFDSFSTFLKRLATERPILVVLDDLHMADHGSLLLLQFVANDVVDTPLALLGTYRDAGVAPGTVLAQVLAAVSRHSWAHRSVLCGLDERDVSRLIEALTGRAPSRPLAEAIHERTDGNPFFLREIATLLGRDDGDRGESSSEWHCALPHTVREMVSNQLRVLTAECVRILASASVLGRDFESQPLAEISSVKATGIETLLEEAVARRIVVRLRQGQYRFNHVLVREIVYDSLPVEDRAALHRQIADALESRVELGGDSMIPMIAHHYFMALPAGDVDRAINAALRAGREAQRHLAYEEAMMHFQRVLDLTSMKVDDRTHCRVLLALGQAQSGAGMWLESRKTFASAAELARRLQSAEEFAQAAIGFKGLMGTTTPVDMDAVALLREAVNLLPTDHSGLLVHVLSALSRSLYFGNVPDEIAQQSKRAVLMAHSSRDEDLILVALEARLMSLWCPCTLDEVFATASDLLNRALRLGRKEIAFNARLYRHYCLLTRGDIDAGHQELSFAEQLAGKHGISVAAGRYL